MSKFKLIQASKLSELCNLCREACRGLDVDPDALVGFMIDADDPDWQTPEAARRIAERMHDGSIVWNPER
ncbi:MAG: hypothetical protein HND55_08845 [Pseudomonadota bacterium]|nr:MAG: hypothetical protein HND55_08845 [Pseudomonadota bacterium]